MRGPGQLPGARGRAPRGHHDRRPRSGGRRRAFASAQRDADGRATADTVADRLIAADSPLTERRNVLNTSHLDAAAVESMVPDETTVRAVVDGEDEINDNVDSLERSRLDSGVAYVIEYNG